MLRTKMPSSDYAIDTRKSQSTCGLSRLINICTPISTRRKSNAGKGVTTKCRFWGVNRVCRALIFSSALDFDVVAVGRSRRCLPLGSPSRWDRHSDGIAGRSRLLQFAHCRPSSKDQHEVGRPSEWSGSRHPGNGVAAGIKRDRRSLSEPIACLQCHRPPFSVYHKSELVRQYRLNPEQRQARSNW
jgi:hypothetical protein